MNTDYKQKCIIVDDEPQNVAVLEHLCNEFFSNDIEIINTFNIATEALKFINSEKIDIIFLDIEMPELSGFELIRAISNQSKAKIIIVSSHDEYALKAFRHSVFDFLKKPVSITDIRECLNKIEKQAGSSSQGNEHEISDNILVVNRQDKTIFIDIQQILRMEAAGSYTDIYLEDGTKINSTKKMNYYESILSKHPFHKLHRSHFVNLNKIREIIKNEGDGMVVMQDGSRIEISRAKKDEFLRSIIKDKKL
jgi:two-component system LytT family response regulator